MAGVVPKKTSSRRKQWTLRPMHDQGKSSLKELRNQLASDGCPDSQVVVAKRLLEEECELESESKENARSGVDLLVKASEQGNLEATELLKTCLKSGKGIDNLNYLDVQSCISMSQDKKLARKAARETFVVLSNGGDFITSDQLQRRILAIDKGQQFVPPINEGEANGGELFSSEDDSSDESWSLHSDCNNEKITEDQLISAAVDYSSGQLPAVSRHICLSGPNPQALDHIPLFHRSILHPFLVLKILYYKIIKTLGRQFKHLLPMAKDTQLIVLLIVYTILSAENVLLIFPLLAYYLTFTVMIITTFQMMHTQREFVDFRLWSGLFLCYSGGDVNTEQAENQYLRNNLKPYGHFFIALLVNLLVYPVIVEQWIPQSELTIISFCLTFMTLIGFMPKNRTKTVFDLLVLASFAINVLAKYPYETDPVVVAQGWRFLDLNVPTFASYVIGNGIEFCINFRGLLYACIPLLLVRIASKDGWKGIYKTFVPHCVTLSWLQMCIISSQGATMYGLLRGTLILVHIILFLPLVGITTIILPAAAFAQWIVTSNIVYNLSIFIILFIGGMAVCRLSAQSRFRKITALIQILLSIVAIFSLIHLNKYQSDDVLYRNDKEPEFLSWEIYQRFCHQPVWQEENVAISQMKCAELENSHVQWDGYITDIKVKSISNYWKNLFDKLPLSLKQLFYCSFGEDIIENCSHYPDVVRNDCISFQNALKSTNRCSLQKYNTYTFEIITKMNSGIWSRSPEVSIIVDNYFSNFTLRLKPNDHIWFKGTLLNNDIVGSDGILGGTKTHVILKEIGCLGCVNNILSDVSVSINKNVNVCNIIDNLSLGLKFILNLLFNPILMFK